MTTSTGTYFTSRMVRSYLDRLVMERLFVRFGAIASDKRERDHPERGHRLFETDAACGIVLA